MRLFARSSALPSVVRTLLRAPIGARSTPEKSWTNTSLPGNPGENTLLPHTISELDSLGLTPKEVALDGGFTLTATNGALSDLAPERVFIAGRATNAAVALSALTAYLRQVA